MRRPRVLGTVVPLLAAVALVAAGCGSDNKSSSTAPRAVAPAAAGDSLFTAANLRVALDAIGAKLGSSPKITTFKIEPTSVTATAGAGGKFKVLTSDKAGTVNEAQAPAGVTVTFPLSQIDAASPSKVIAALESKYSKKLDDVDYMVAIADPVSKKPFWDIFVKGGVDGPYQADIDGTNLATAAERAAAVMTTPNGAPTIPSPSGAPAPQALPPDIAKIQRCVTKAANDPAKAADCIRHAKIRIPKPK